MRGASLGVVTDPGYYRRPSWFDRNIFNPAVAVGLIVMGLSGPTSLIIHLIADFLGGAAAAYLFNALDMGGDKQSV